MLNVTFGYIFDYVAYVTDSTSMVVEAGVPREALLAGLLPAAVPESLIAGMPMFGGAIMLILGGLTIGSGYGWGTFESQTIVWPALTDWPEAIGAGVTCLRHVDRRERSGRHAGPQPGAVRRPWARLGRWWSRTCCAV